MWRFNVTSNNKRYLGLNVKGSIFLPDCNKICIFSTHFKKSIKVPNIKLHGNPSSGSCADTVYADEWTEIMHIGTFLGYENAPKNA